MKLNIKNILFIIFTLLFVAISCGKKTEETEYEVSVVQTGDLSLSVSKTGQVVSENEISVYTTASQRVSKVYFKKGDNVKKGDIVVTFYPIDKNEKLRDIESKKLDIRQAERNLHNAQELFKVGGETAVNVDDARIALNKAKLELADLNEDLSLIKDNITSPVDGVITEMTADDDYRVNIETTLFKVSDSSNMRVEVELSDTQMKNIQVGQRVEITSDSLPDGEKVEGVVSQIAGVAEKSSSLDESNTTVKIQMTDPKSLKPGATINATIFYSENNNVVKIPYSAVMSENQKYYVFTVDGQNKITKKEISIGVNDDSYYVVTSGVNAGDKIISIVDENLKDGQMIKVFDPAKARKNNKNSNQKRGNRGNRGNRQGQGGPDGGPGGSGGGPGGPR